MNSPTDSNAFPENPIAAVTHRDPYPYYADLVARAPIYRDDTLGLWVAASAGAVTAVLTSDLCRVRPPNEPIPTALLGSPAADIFGHLIRMNDGSGHCPFNRAVAATLASLDQIEIAERSARWGRRLFDNLDLATSRDRLTDFAFQMPVHAIGSLLGVPQDKLPQTAQWIGDFVRCVFPGSTPAQVEQGKLAAGQLLDMFHALLESGRADSTGGLLMTLAREAERFGRAAVDVIVANGIGFLSQAYDATAGLIGNALVALAAHPDVRRQVAGDASLAHKLVMEVLRYDPPTHNTRRFVAADGIVAGREMKVGDAILVVVAAANRDPAANPRPELLDLFRPKRKLYTFGAGIHACPGDVLAVTIAQAGVSQLLASGLNIDGLHERLVYRPSANTRVPLFANQGAH